MPCANDRWWKPPNSKHYSAQRTIASKSCSAPYSGGGIVDGNDGLTAIASYQADKPARPSRQFQTGSRRSTKPRAVPKTYNKRIDKPLTRGHLTHDPASGARHALHHRVWVTSDTDRSAGSFEQNAWRPQLGEVPSPRLRKALGRPAGCVARLRLRLQGRRPHQHLAGPHPSGCWLPTHHWGGSVWRMPGPAATAPSARQSARGDTVVVWALDRLSRSLQDTLDIMERIGAAGAGFGPITENIDTTTPAGRMMMQMVGAFAEFERAMIRKRTSAGLAAAPAEGRIGARRKKLDNTQRGEIAGSVITGRNSGADMARLYNVSQPTISRIIAVHRP